MKEPVEMGLQKEKWLKQAEATSGTPVENKKTLSGLDSPPLATPDDAQQDYADKIGFPGSPPFTRGVYPTMYLGRPWTMRQYAGFASADETNARFKYLLDQGQSGLSVAFDLPTQTGYDSDDEEAEVEVGRLGVTVDSLQDMEKLFDGIPLDKISTSFTINATAAVILAMYIALGEKQGIAPEKLRGTVQNDILKEYVARGTYIFPPAPSMRLVTDIIEYCATGVPKFNTISISGYHMREAGCSAVNEVAFTLGNALAYVDSVLERGIAVDSFASRLSFFFATNNDLFEEIAKYRAARRIWANLMKDRYGATDPKSLLLRFHSQTSGSSVTAEQPLNNISRITIQALAAVLGGCQSLHTCSYDEAFTIPTEESARIALRTQQIIAYESGVTNTIDPLGGSYYVENLTDQMEARVLEKLDSIEQNGGMVKMIEQGSIQKEITSEAYEHEKKIENGNRVLVGHNKFRLENEHTNVELHKHDLKHVEKCKQGLKKLRESRDSERVAASLSSLGEAAAGKENLMPFFIDAVKSYATIGEITGTLKKVFGEFRDDTIL
ncbi:MAG TPA: methylmalonyl-CoA mutase family protein [bacterium]|nr:methylmalonyl-CoA mutase family protein [bacterium]